jgi:hypothetical protein
MEDRDVEVIAAHGITGTEISVRFRLEEIQMKGSPKKLRARIETLATDQLLNFASFLETFER